MFSFRCSVSSKLESDILSLRSQHLPFFDERGLQRRLRLVSRTIHRRREVGRWLLRSVASAQWTRTSLLFCTSGRSRRWVFHRQAWSWSLNSWRCFRDRGHSSERLLEVSTFLLSFHFSGSTQLVHMAAVVLSIRSNEVHHSAKLLQYHTSCPSQSLVFPMRHFHPDFVVGLEFSRFSAMSSIVLAFHSIVSSSVLRLSRFQQVQGSTHSSSQELFIWRALVMVVRKRRAAVDSQESGKSFQ